MPYHEDGGYSLPEKVHLWQVSFAHEFLFEDFRRWAQSRGMDVCLLPECCKEANSESSVNLAHFCIVLK